MKLTMAQFNLFREVYTGNRTTVCETYKPAVKLVQLGLAKIEQRKLDSRITLTELGIAEARRIFG